MLGLQNGFNRIRENLTQKQLEHLCERLVESGFHVPYMRQITVIDPEPDFPRDSRGAPITLGYLVPMSEGSSSYRVDLTTHESPILRGHLSKIQRICEAV